MEYLHHIVDIHTEFFRKKNNDFIRYIKAIHLHQSLSGKYVKNHLQNLKYPLFYNSNIDFYEKFRNEIERNNKNRILPKIDGIQSIECQSHGAIQNDEQNGTAKYVIQMRITYFKDYNEKQNISL